MDKVIITPLNGIKTSMRQALHRDDLKNSYIVRQDFVKAEKEFIIQILFNINMKKELSGMYLGIGTPAAVNVYCRF